MMKSKAKSLAELRARFGGDNTTAFYDPEFLRASKLAFSSSGTRAAPYAGIATLLNAPYRNVRWDSPDLKDLDVALLGAPTDLGVTNRPGARFGPRALRTIERIGPYNHALRTMPVTELRVADVGDVPFRSRYDLEGNHADIEKAIGLIAASGAIPLTAGGDHSITLPILRALGKDGPVGLVHIDAHCDTGGSFDGCKFHHGGPFRHAVLEGVLDPLRTIQIGIRGSAEYLWEFSYEAGMTVVHAEQLESRGVEEVVAQARAVVGPGKVYVSFDIDGLDPSYAPGTGTPEVGGISMREAQALVRGLAGLNIIGGDVVEVAPEYDANTNTAQCGAQMLFEILSLIAVRRREPKA
ncbi:MAG TPA: agmatinase [Steroidobacteraceae bacterium]|jgi:agmatinase